jgi:hypothetical protein
MEGHAMNERIRELADQAGFDAVSLEVFNIEQDLKKFAELIVKECIDINQQELSFNAFEQLMNRYQKQFGVEL